MSQPPTITSLADMPLSSAARLQFQQYLSRVPASTSASSSSSSNPAPLDLETLLHRSAYLTTRVGELHSRLSNIDLVSFASSRQEDDPQLFWSTLTLLTHLRQLSAQLQRQRGAGLGGKVQEALTRTQQNVDTVEALLRLLSVSSSQSVVGDTVSAPLSDISCGARSSRPTIHGAGGYGSGQKGYEYWKARTVSVLHADSPSDTNSSSRVDDLGEDDVDAASETDSILTDPELHSLAPTSLSPTTPSSHSTDPHDDPDMSEYDRAPPTASVSSPPPNADANANAGDTILQSDRATHEALSSELLRMASVLRSNSLAFADSLERDRLLLEKSGSDLTHNLDLMTRTRGRLGLYSKQARSMGCFTLSTILIVILSWMLMFLLIRLT